MTAHIRQQDLFPREYFPSYWPLVAVGLFSIAFWVLVTWTVLRVV